MTPHRWERTEGCIGTRFGGRFKRILHITNVLYIAVVRIRQPLPWDHHTSPFPAIQQSTLACSQLPPPTLARLQGLWHEIGCTATFKVQFESGLSCNIANYSTDGTSINGANKVK